HGARPPDRPRRECDPMEVDRAGSRPVEAGDGAQQRRLSAAALADDAQALGPVDDEPDALNRRGACTAVLAPDVGGLEQHVPTAPRGRELVAGRRQLLDLLEPDAA